MRPSPSTVARPNWLPLVGIGVLVVWFAFALLAGGGGAAACAAPPRGYHAEPAPWTYLWMFGPGAITFLVSAYLALGVRRVRLRWLLLVPCIALALAVTFVAVVAMPYSCGISVSD